jgi:hypothetical protein
VPHAAQLGRPEMLLDGDDVGRGHERLTPVQRDGEGRIANGE